MACSSKSVKFMKVISLILDTGTVALSYRLKHEVKNAGLNFSQFLIANRHKLFHLYERRNCCECRSAQNRGKVFSKYQWETLFKVNHSVKVCNSKNPCVCQYEPQTSVGENELDLSILCAILQNACSLQPAEMQDVKNLREKRNTFLHTKAASIEEDVYLKEFSSIRSTIESISFHCGQEVFNKVKDEIKNISKSELNDNMCRHVFSLLFHIKETTDEKLDSIFQEIQKIKQCITREFLDNKTTGQLKSISKDLGQIETHTSSQGNVYDCTENRSSIPTVDVLECGSTGTSLVSNDKCGMEFKRKRAVDNRNEDKKRSKSQECTQMEKSNTLASDQLETKVDKENHQSESTVEGLHFTQMATGSGLHSSCLGGKTESEYPDLNLTVDENGWRAVHFAAQKENIHFLKVLAEESIPVTETTKDNATILHIACENAQYEMCQHILSQYPDMLKVVETKGWNAAHFASQGGDVCILQLLEEEGLSVTETTKDNLTILHIACLYTQIEMCQYILSQYPYLLKALDTKGRNAAHFAAQGGDVRILQLLAEAGLPATETTKDNLTILQTACGNAQYEMCQHILLRYPDMLKVVATKGWNAAHFAAQGGDIRILQLLAEAGLPATETTKDNLTILQIACGNAQYEMCQHILLQYPDMLKVVEPKGGSVAYFAAQGGDVRILQLLAEAGLSVFETRKDNWTILHSACLNAQYKMCQYILSQYPYMLEVVDTDGWNAAHYAAKGGDVRILQILVEEGLSLNETTKDNLTMLHIACLTTQHKMCQYILSKYPNMLKAVDINGFNAAHHAAQGGDVRILQLLAEAGLTVTETTKDNRTILHIACLNAQYKICQYILSQYPNMLKAVDTYGWNAAHFAAEGGDANILQLLLEEGLPATETTRDNLTILHIACRNAQYEICQLILSQYPNMLNDVDTTGKKATHYASQGGDVRILQLLTKKQVHLIASNDK